MSPECEASEGLIFIGRTQEVVCFLKKLAQIDALLCKVVKGIEEFPEYLCDEAPPFVFPDTGEPEPEEPVYICPLDCVEPTGPKHVFICEITNALIAELELTKDAVCALYESFVGSYDFIKTPCPE